ncbi:MAG: ImmA/IrrE family metallo-endopeptidase [Deltaproteobacteria bacterium]|nr:ImmA/IrrE family metallo-endopeptidase [Deltaproteobacteria bacterium]
MHIEIQPHMLSWACRRAGYTIQQLAERIPQLVEWEAGEIRPTLKQIERFAKTVHVPVGYLFLKTPPKENVPIPDFRTVSNKHLAQPSPDLLDTIYICQQRQSWYREYAVSYGEKPLYFVKQAKIADDPRIVAKKIRHALGFEIAERQQMKTWEEALRKFIEQVDELGVLVMVNGVVGNNNKRKLDPEEFRGFTLSDELAPLIYINGADSKSAQMFTLAHELAHIWLGESGLSNFDPTGNTKNKIELWSNRVAAEILVPLEQFKSEYQNAEDLSKNMNVLARCFKVSTLVILRRIYDAGYITQDQFWKGYKAEVKRLHDLPKGSGGNFYLTQSARVSKRFARSLISSTLEGITLHRDAFRLLGFSKHSTFEALGHSLGVI